MAIRVLLASPHKGKGGITRWTEHILNYYHDTHQDSLELDLLAMDRYPFTNPITRLYYGMLEYSKIILKERSMLRRGHYDVLHLCSSANVGLLKDWMMLKIALYFHVRTVLHLHFGRIPTLAKTKGWEWWLLCKVMCYADVTVLMDEQSSETMIKMGFDNVINLPNPISPIVLEYVKLHENSIQRDEKMIFFAGEHLKTKGIRELVLACKDIPGVHLVMAGYVEKSTRRELIRMSEGRIEMDVLGQLPYEEVLRLMMKCDVFVLPSYTEGFPNVILESMACGCAIIGTAVGAIPEMLKIEDGQQYGLIVPPKDTQKLKEALLQFLNDFELKSECRRNSKVRVSQKYGIETVWETLVLLWTDHRKNFK